MMNMCYHYMKRKNESKSPSLCVYYAYGLFMLIKCYLHAHQMLPLIIII